MFTFEAVDGGEVLCELVSTFRDHEEEEQPRGSTVDNT